MENMPEGYEVIQRTWPETPAGGKLIVWWEKGYEPDTYIKCEGDSPFGYECEGYGETLEEALKNLVEWFKMMDEEHLMVDSEA